MDHVVQRPGDEHQVLALHRGLVALVRHHQVVDQQVARVDLVLDRCVALVGDVQAAGLTPDRLSEQLKQALSEYINKPDVTVEYNFYQKLPGSPEKFFNKTNPQNLNAQTLPKEFDFAAGHQLQSGQAVPLASFPEGEYRLEIKVTDKIANKTLTRDVNFSVSGS